MTKACAEHKYSYHTRKHVIITLSQRMLQTNKKDHMVSWFNRCHYQDITVLIISMEVDLLQVNCAIVVKKRTIQFTMTQADIISVTFC